MSKHHTLLRLGLCAAGVLVLLTVLSWTNDYLWQHQQQKNTILLLDEILATVPHDNNLANSAFLLAPSNTLFNQNELLGLSLTRPAFVATEQGEPTAIVLPLETLAGFGGRIVLMIGIRTDGSIEGVRVVQHNKTARLGDKIELIKSNWILSFNNRSLNNTDPLLWKVKKDGGEFDQFTGATITPRAIVNAVENALNFFAANRAALFNQERTPLLSLVTDANQNLTSRDSYSFWLLMFHPSVLFGFGLALALRKIFTSRLPKPNADLPAIGSSKRVRVTGKQ